MAYCLRAVSSKLIFQTLSINIKVNPKLLKSAREPILLQFYRQFRLSTKLKAVPARFNTKNKAPTILLAGILTLLGFKEKEEEEDAMIMIIKRGILCLQRDEYENAEIFLHEALKLAQERQDMEGQRYIFDLLANAAYNKRDFSKAESLFLQVTKELVINGTPVDDNAIVEISLKLASIYSFTNEIAKAEEGYRYCIETQQKKVNFMNFSDPNSLSDKEKDSALLLGMSFDWYARHLLARGIYEGALENFRKALDISEKLNGPSHSQTLVLMNDVGSIVSLQKDYDKAIEWFEKTIDRVTKDNNTPEVPTFYCNLGATYFQKGDLDAARKACLIALNMAKKRNNPEAEIDAKECLNEIKNAKGKIT